MAIKDWPGAVLDYFQPTRRLMRAAVDFALSRPFGYDSAKPNRALPSRVIGASGDFHSEATRDRLEVMQYVREAERNNALVCSTLDRSVEMICGDGFRLQALTDDPEWNEEAEQAFKEWAENPDTADVRGLQDFNEMVETFVRGWLRDGDALFVKTNLGKLQLIEADRLAAPLDKRYTPHHIDGIELDANTGRPTRYYIIPYLETDHFVPRPYDMPERRQVSAKDVIFLANRTRASQTRGVSTLASSIEWLRNLDKYVEATVIASRMAACFGVLLTKQLPPTANPNLGTADDGVSLLTKLQPGMVQYLAEGESAQQLDPKQPHTQFGEFVKNMTRIAGLPAGLPLEVVMMDFTGSNYSNSRAALMTAYRNVRRKQRAVKCQVLGPMWRWWVNWAMGTGILRTPRGNPDTRYRHAWIPSAFGWLDPIKEVQAAQMSMDAGLSTLTEELARLGKDFNETMTARARENDTLEEMGIVFSKSTATRDPSPEMTVDFEETEEPAEETEEETSDALQD